MIEIALTLFIAFAVLDLIVVANAAGKALTALADYWKAKAEMTKNLDRASDR